MYKELRAICCKLGVGGYKNKKKDFILELLAAKKMNEAIYDEIFSPKDGKTTTKKEIQCPFRLCNIVFSDAYAEKLARIGDKATRPELDSGKLNDEMFWRDVQATFADKDADEAISRLQFEHPALEDMSIDPSKIVHHDWKRLQSIFKATNSAYKKSLVNFRMSGTHTSDFYSFCQGKLDVLYLHFHLQNKPGLNEAIEADLLNAVFDETEKTADLNDQNEDLKSASSASSSKSRRPNDIAAAINNFVDSSMQSELAKQKLDIMMKKEARLQKQAQNDEEKQRFNMFSEISDRIKSLRRELKNEDDEDNIEDIKEEIEMLKEKKKKFICRSDSSAIA